MSHHEAAEHLREEVIGTCQRETGRLVDPADPAYFGAVRGVLSDLEYPAALWDGWDGVCRRQIATSRKSVKFLSEVVAPATGDRAYAELGKHLFELFRVGTVHLRAPKRLIVHDAGTEVVLTWALMSRRRETIRLGGQEVELEHLRPKRVGKPVGRFTSSVILPLAIDILLEDFVSACEAFAVRLEVEAQDGGKKLISRWRSAANALCEPEPSKLPWPAQRGEIDG